MNIVGKGIAKIDGMSIATGKPVYTDYVDVQDIWDNLEQSRNIWG